MAKIYN